MYKAVQHLCGCCILDMQQCLGEPIDVDPLWTLALGTLGPLISCLAGSINGHELLLEEEFKLLQS